MSSVRLTVKSRLVVFKVRRVKGYMRGFDCTSVGVRLTVSNPSIVQRSAVKVCFYNLHLLSSTALRYIFTSLIARLSDQNYCH